MPVSIDIRRRISGPGNRRRSYSEQADEAPKLLEHEPVEIERELPAEDNSPVERIENDRRDRPPLFEE